MIFVHENVVSVILICLAYPIILRSILHTNKKHYLLLHKIFSKLVDCLTPRGGLDFNFFFLAAPAAYESSQVEPHTIAVTQVTAVTMLDL